MTVNGAKPRSPLGRLGSGLAWTSVATVSNHLLNLLRVMIVARILTPAEFGVFGMCMTVLFGISALGDFGLKDAFIAHEYKDDGERERWLNAIWSGNLVVKILLGLLLVACAAPAAKLYAEPSLFPMVVALAAVPVLTALSNPALMLLEKRITFTRVALYELGVSVSALVATVALAWLLRSAWALVLGQIAGVGFGTILSYFLQRSRPYFRLDREPIVKSLHFGKYLMAISVMTFFTTQFDNMLIGAQIGAAALGVYVIAYRISAIPTLMIGASVSRTLFPYYAETLSAGHERLALVWLGSFALIGWLLLAAYLPLMFSPEYFIVLLFGDQWRASAPLLEVLAVVGILRGIGRGVNPLFKALRRTDVDAASKLLETVVFVPAVFYGIAVTQDPIGAAWAGLVAYSIGATARVASALWLVRPGVGLAIRHFARPLVGGAAMVATAYATLAAGWHALLVTAAVWLVWAGLMLALEQEARRFVTARLASRALGKR